jgi:hypothetical protein
LLTAESYQTAWLAYVAATLGALLIMYFWTRNWIPRGLRLVLFLVLAALVLTPAHPAPDVQSWAPAIVVAGFELLTDGTEAALRPLRSVLAAEAIAVALCLLGWLLVRVTRRRAGPAGDA